MAAQLGHSLLPLATSPDSVLLSSPSAEYAANASFDTAGKGYITLRDLENAVGAHERTPAVQEAIRQAYALRYYRPAPRLLGPVLFMAALAAAAGYGAHRLLPRRRWA